MARASTGYQKTYAKLLLLYPASYQKRFAEPMLQTFSDLCRERAQSGKGLFWFAAKSYSGTFVEIIKEHIKEGIMSSKATKLKVLAAAGSIGALAFVVGLVFMNSNRTAQTIPAYSRLEQARELSKGKKDAYLMDSQQAVDAIKQDDRTYDFKDQKISKFETTAALGIMDVPAGTEYKLTMHSYENGIARGAIAYEYGYGIYNYEIKKLPGDGEWEMVQVVACERS